MSNFTGILADIEEVIGTSATLLLATKCGGQEIVIPKKPNEKSALTNIIGLEFAQKLSREYGYGKILVPMGHFKGMGRKKVLAAKMLEQGMSSNAIAAELDIHERTVRRVKEKNYLGLPLIEYIEEQERKEHEKKNHSKS